MKTQKSFNDKVIGKHLNQKEIEAHTKDLVLCAQSELSSLLSAVNYKSHRTDVKIDAARDTVIYESVDIIRYSLAILNTWGIKPEEYTAAFNDKDIYLNARKRIDENPWDGEKPVAIVDIDDVLAEFRFCFAEWLMKEKNINADVDSEEYYFITAISKSEENPEDVFEDFLTSGGFRNLAINSENLKIIKRLKNDGYWVQLLTARPSGRHRCLYDTYAWLEESGVPYDDLSFATEKFRWCAGSKYYEKGKIAFAIDDAPKHVNDYSVHGVRCFVPEKSYNKKIDNNNVKYFKNYESFFDHNLVN